MLLASPHVRNRTPVVQVTCPKVKQLITSRTETETKSVLSHFSEFIAQDWDMHGDWFPSPSQSETSKFQELVSLIRSEQRNSKDEGPPRARGRGERDEESRKSPVETHGRMKPLNPGSV